MRNASSTSASATSRSRPPEPLGITLSTTAPSRIDGASISRPTIIPARMKRASSRQSPRHAKRNNGTTRTGSSGGSER